MKLLRSSPHSRQFCLPLACLLALSACAPGTSGTTAEPAPIEVPPPVEQTNEGLTVFYTDFKTPESNILDVAVAQYKEQHPDQLLNAEKVFTEGLVETHTAAYNQMLTEIMAGSGPDLIFFANYSTGSTTDWEKLVCRGAFADMEPYFEADNFDWSGYNQAVMDGGVYDGQRLIIPLEYKIPLLYTSQSALEETGFSVENCGTFDGFLDEVEKMMADPEQTRDVFRTKLSIYDFAQYADIPYIDYDRQKADLSFPELERGAEIYKALPRIMDSDDLPGAADIRDGNALWIYPNDPVRGFLWGAGLINTYDDVVMMPIRDMEGGIQAEITFAVAVNSSSPNLQNAYEFIKLLLSEEFQKDTVQYRWAKLSVLDAAVAENYQYNTWHAEDGKVELEQDSSNLGFTYIDPSPEDFEEMMSYTKQVTGTFFRSSETQFIQLLGGYITDETSYRDAIDAAESQLNIYLSE